MVINEHGAVVRLDDGAPTFFRRGRRQKGRTRKKPRRHRVLLNDPGPADPSPRRIAVLGRWIRHRNRRAGLQEPPTGGFKYLAAALLASAIVVDVPSKYSARRALCALKSARAWIRGDTAPEGITFNDCCDALRLDPDALRSRILGAPPQTRGNAQSP